MRLRGFVRTPTLAPGAAALGLLVAVALLLGVAELRWAAVVLVLAAAFASIVGAFQVRSAIMRAVVRHEQEAPDRQGTDSGLPVHPATGLYRWWVFRERVIEEIARAARHERRLTIVLLEPANLLSEPSPDDYALAAKRLRHALRTQDFAAQFDEERFVVLLPETDAPGAKVAAKRLLATLHTSGEHPARWRGAIACYPEDGDNPDKLLERANILLRPGRLESTTEAMSTAESDHTRSR